MEKQTPNKPWYVDHGSWGHLKNSLRKAISQRPKNTENLGWERGTCGKACHQNGSVLIIEFIACGPNEQLYL